MSIAFADCAERTRRFSFLIIIAIALYAGYLYVPDIHAGYATIIVNDARGVYASPYLGAAIAVLTGAFLGLFGFFFIRGSVERDPEFDVDGIVCASSVTRLRFLYGKFFSNLAVLMAIATISYLAAMFMQELRGEDRHLQVLQYVTPLVLISLPGMAFVAALGVLFDVVRPLRGAVGGVVYVLLIWTPMLTIAMSTSHHMTTASPFDAQGVTSVIASINNAGLTKYPKVAKGTQLEEISVGGSPAPKSGMRTFPFAGIVWTPGIFAQRAVWFLLALAIVAASGPLFDRFARETSAARRATFQIDVTRLIPNLPGLYMFRAELALLLNGANPWWILGALALAIVSALLPPDKVAAFVLPVALIWPLERFSALGSREQRWNVTDILCSSSGYARKAMLAQCAAGTLIGTLICTGYLVRTVASGHAITALACVLVVAATAAVALAIGLFAASPKPFEAIYLLVWYIGPVNHVRILDFSMATQAEPVSLSAITALLFVAAIIATAVMREVRRAR